MAAVIGLVSLAGSGVAGAGGLSVLLALAAFGAAAYWFLSAHQMGIFFRNNGGGVLSAPAGKAERPLVEHAKWSVNHVLFGAGDLPGREPGQF